VFHGHAHNGILEGKTARDIRVFNVAWPVLMRAEKKALFYYDV
jgi:hypothetical protein